MRLSGSISLGLPRTLFKRERAASAPVRAYPLDLSGIFVRGQKELEREVQPIGRNRHHLSSNRQENEIRRQPYNKEGP
jgi:hypothetical protein